jgi:hypothetical protein
MRDDGKEFVFHPVRRFRLFACSLLANKQLFSLSFGLLALDGKSNCAGQFLYHPQPDGARRAWIAEVDAESSQKSMIR